MHKRHCAIWFLYDVAALSVPETDTEEAHSFLCELAIEPVSSRQQRRFVVMARDWVRRTLDAKTRHCLPSSGRYVNTGAVWTAIALSWLIFAGVILSFRCSIAVSFWAHVEQSTVSYRITLLVLRLELRTWCRTYYIPHAIKVPRYDVLFLFSRIQ